MSVPKLRFLEFQDALEWEEKTLIELAKFRRGSFPQPYGLPEWYDEENGTPFIQVFDVGDNMLLKAKTKNKISKIGAKQSVFISKGTLIVTLQGSIGRIAITQYDAYIDRTLLIFESFLKPMEKLFFAYIIQSLFEIEKEKAPGGIIKTITKEALSSFKVKFPSLLEQQKIADCLSSLETVITAQSQKLEALKNHKKGLMQQLFPSAEETVPKLRFLEFRDAGEWEEKKLSDIATIKSGSTPLRSNDKFYAGGNIPWVKTTDLNNSFIYLTEECITSYAKARINPEDSILVAMYGGFNQIGRTGYLKVPAATNQAISVVNVNKKIVLSLYLLMWLNAKVENWKTFASSSRKDPNITGSDVANFLVVFPSLLEQQKIASCLTSLESLITTQKQKLETLKTFKKGLMQQLFPQVSDGTT